MSREEEEDNQINEIYFKLPPFFANEEYKEQWNNYLAERSKISRNKSLCDSCFATLLFKMLELRKKVDELKDA